MDTDTIRVHCHGCHVTMMVPYYPVEVTRGVFVIPRLNAPFICSSCRLNKHLLFEARKEMGRYLSVTKT